MTMKVFLKVTLVSLTRRVSTIFYNFRKTQAISLFWFHVQHKTCTSKHEKLGLFYLTFSSKFNELSLTFQKQQQFSKTND